jgi:hypothetical protein
LEAGIQANKVSRRESVAAPKPATASPAAQPETVGLRIDRAIARARGRLAGTRLGDRMRAGRG